jgi:hypothetical protein
MDAAPAGCNPVHEEENPAMKMASVDFDQHDQPFTTSQHRQQNSNTA